MAQKLMRVRDQVFASREEAIAAGWADAEWGWWVPSNGDLKRACWGWIALTPDED